MSDCSGIRKVYMRPEELGMSEYIDLSDQNNDERISEFVRTVELAVDSLEREKYSVQIFADIINVAYNRVNDIFSENVNFIEDCVITSPYIIIDEAELYLNFENGIKLCLEKYKKELIDVNTFYNHISRDCKILENALNFGHKSKVKTNIK